MIRSLLVANRGETYEVRPQERRRDLIIAAVAVLYTAFLVFAGAISLGLWTAGVLTGISTRAEFEGASPQPDLIAENLPDLIARLRWADQH